MTPTDWRQYDTPEARAAFQDAQARIDDCQPREGGGWTTNGVDNYTPEMRDADEKLADRYDRLVLQPAHYEFERDCARDEFNRAWPEPADDSYITWGEDITWGAHRCDLPGDDGKHWYMFNDPRDRGRMWETLVGEHYETMHSIHDVRVLREDQP